MLNLIPRMEYVEVSLPCGILNEIQELSGEICERDAETGGGGGICAWISVLDVHMHSVEQ